MKALCSIALFFFVAAITLPGRASVIGSVDESFQASPSPGISFIIPQPDGLIVGGTFSDWEAIPVPGLVRLDLTGHRDPDFAPAVENGFVLYGLATDSQSRLLAGGELVPGNTGVLYRLLGNGQADPDFTAVRADARFTAIVELPDSRLLVGGNFKNVNGVARPGIARLQSTGQLDLSFAPPVGSLHKNLVLTSDGDYLASGLGLRRYNPDGSYDAWWQFGNSISFFADDLLKTPEGGVWIGGAFSSAKIMPDGGVDLSFTNAFWPTAHAAAVLPDGRSLVAVVDPSNALKHRLVRLFADGIEDKSFDSPTFADKIPGAVAAGPADTAYVAAPGNLGGEILFRLLLQDDSAPPTVQFNRTFAAIGEGNPISVTILRDGNSTGTVTVAYATRADTAVSPDDFTQTNGLISFGPGERFKSILVQTLGSNEPRANRSFFVDLADPDGGTLGTNKTVSVNIIDRESVGVTTINQRNFSETAGPVQFNITRSGSLAYPEPVHWRIEPINPADSNVLTPLEGDSYFEALNPNLFVNLQVADDTLPGTNRFFKVNFSSVDPHIGLNSSNDVVVTVLENDRVNDPGRGTDGRIDQAAFYPDGRLVIGGSFRTVNGAAHPQLARLLPTGEIDTAFLPPLLDGPIPVIRGLIPFTDGKLLVLGSFTNASGLNRKYLVRLNTNGSVDETFDASAALPSQPAAIAKMPDSSLLALGVGATFNGFNIGLNQNLGSVVRLTAEGTKDTTFLTKIKLNTSAAGFIAGLPDGKFIVGGDFGVYSNSPPSNFSPVQPVRRYLARFLANGAWDTNFNAVITAGSISGPSPDTTVVKSLSVGNDGDVLVTGSLSKVNGVNISSIARFNADGSLDMPFTTNVLKRVASTDMFVGGVLAPDGRALLNTQSRVGFSWSSFRVNADGTQDRTLSTFFSQPSISYSQPFWVVADNGAAVLLNTALGMRLAWFYPDGTRAADGAISLRALPFQPDGDFEVQVDGRTSGNLVLQASTDFSAWENVLIQPLVPGLQTVTIPGPIKSNYVFRAAVGLGP